MPPEVWGAGVTYRRSADFREEGLGIYDKIYEAPRPELFFKATASRSAGPHQPVGPQGPAFTAAEPEVCVIVSRGGAILGYTLANDVSAWDMSATTRSTSAVEGLRRLLLVRADDRPTGRRGGSVMPSKSR